MGCSACQQKAAIAQQNAVKSSAQLQNKESVPQPIDCDYTQKVLQNWFNKLDCIKSNRKEQAIGLTMQKLNSYLGYLQSALNYPDNYCYYKTVLEEFQFSILPRIITNVYQCYN